MSHLNEYECIIEYIDTIYEINRLLHEIYIQI